MGKTSGSSAAVSEKGGRLAKLRADIKHAALSKKKLTANAIKKDKEVVIIKDAENKDETMKVLVKKSRPSSKKRRFMQLLKTTPEREEQPQDLKQHQIQLVKKVLQKQRSGDSLSRGQKKRLKKKEKFINSKMIEEKALFT